MSTRYLTIRHAQKIVERHSNSEKRMLDILIRRIEGRIKLVATFKQSYCLCEIPFISDNLPAYNTQQVRDSLIKHFQQQGFWVRPCGQTALYISWRYDSQRGEPATTKSSFTKITPGRRTIYL